MLFDLKKPIMRCPDCGTDTDFLLSQTTDRVFLSTLVERSLFVCPNCRRLSDGIVLRPKEFIRFGLDLHRLTEGIFDTAVKQLARRWELPGQSS
jgi:hypothetical protein